MKLAFAIENIRRISNSPPIEMRPITILVGRNSAGKSTFLRSLPLIRQSLETRSSAPILWFGDLVDFGNPNIAIGEGESGRQAAFKFSISDLRGKRRRDEYYLYAGYFRQHPSVHVERVSIRYVIGIQEERTMLQTIEVEIPDEEIDIRFDFGARSESIGRITVDGTPMAILPKGYEIRTVDRNLFSPPLFVLRQSESERKVGRWVLRPDQVFSEALVDLFKSQSTRNLSDQTYRREARRIVSEDRLDVDTIRRLRISSSTVTFKRIYDELLVDKESVFKSRVFSIRKLSRVFTVLEIIEDLLTEYFLNVGYLEPVRAASERFYRRQELEVSEIAPNGSNFPIFLASLNPRELQRFSNWVEEIFGYRVQVHTTVGHISVHLNSGKRSVNVTDTGYGVSQILPVLGMIWWAQNARDMPRGPRRYRTGIRTLAIEQPELHLHPAHQAKLADVFVSAIRRGERGEDIPETRLVIETHSEALIRRLGELVEEKAVEADAIQIVVFSAQEDLDSPTEVSIATFDDLGVLENWPFGFFNYSDK